jgi:hypothetical protein
MLKDAVQAPQFALLVQPYDFLLCGDMARPTTSLAR